MKCALAIALLVGAAVASPARAAPPWAWQPHGRSRVLVTGATGTGKSVFAREYMRGIWRLAAYDSEGEFDFLRWMYVDEFALRWREFRHGVLRVAVRPRPGRLERGHGGEHELFCEAAHRIARNGSPLLTAHEEVSGYAGASQMFPWFRHLTVRGRKRGLSMLVTGQDLSLFPTTYRRNASRVIAYAQPNATARRALEELLDRDAHLVGQLAPPPEDGQPLDPDSFNFVDCVPMRGARIRPRLAVAT